MMQVSRNVFQSSWQEAITVHWTFLSNHAQVMLCIAQDPSIRLRDIGGLVGITERAAHRIVGELVEAGYLERDRIGRRNRYTISTQMPLPEAIARNQRIGDLLSVLTAQPSPPHTELSQPPRAAAG